MKTISGLIALALLCACGKQPKSPTEAITSSGTTTTNTVVPQPTGASSMPNSHADPSSSIPWFPGSVDAAFAEARRQNKPVFLFWGATWCPYCQDLKASVFPRPDFIAKLKFFIPVNLDGDAPGAQKISEEFRVSGYPTVLVLKPDRTELARISGGMDLNRYADVLDSVLGDDRPVKEILASLEKPDVTLSADDCRRLAYNAWSLDPENTSGPDELRATSAALARAAKRCPVASKIERARLTILATAAATDAEEEALKAGTPLNPSTVTQIGEVRSILADPSLATSVGDSLQELTENFFAAAKSVSPANAKSLLRSWTTIMDGIAADKRYSDGTQLAAVASELTAAKTLTSDGAIPPKLASAAKHHLDEALSHKQDAYTRAAVVNAAIDILEALGERETAYTMVEAELKTANAPYYYMSHLASLDEELGRTDAALAWRKRAYEESKGSATRFRWGTSYVTALTRLRPTDAPAIRAATLSVLGELDTPAALHGGTAVRLKRLGEVLRKWSATAEYNDVILAARAQLDDICGKATHDEGARAACEGFVSG